jgi:hypothetical protein
MKKVLLLNVLVLLLATFVFAQTERRPDPGMPPLEKIQQWEKMKLIEVLDLDEGTAIKFFARRNEYEQKIKESVEERNKQIREISNEIRKGTKFNDSDCLEKLNTILNSETSIIKNREAFLKSLTDILSPQQILKLAVFEHHFRNEIRQKLIEKRKGDTQD